MRRHLRALGNDRRVDVSDSPAGVGQDAADRAQQGEAVGARVGGVIVREVLSDVTERRGAQQSVHDRVQQHVRVRVPQKSELIGDLYASDDEVAPLGEAVHVVSETHSDHMCSSDLRGSARGRQSLQKWLVFSPVRVYYSKVSLISSIMRI